MPQSYTQLYYHMVFSTKDRHPWIVAEVQERLYPFMAGGVKAEGGHAIIINGTEDHIHIFAKLRQDKALSDVLRNLKADSSGWIHKQFPELGAFAWQKGYGAFTVSKSQEPRVKRYVEKQKEHHKRLKFQEEFIGLLDAHDIEYDPKYLWE
jgi:putative transposase